MSQTEFISEHDISTVADMATKIAAAIVQANARELIDDEGTGTHGLIAEVSFDLAERLWTERKQRAIDWQNEGLEPRSDRENARPPEVTP